MLAFGWCPSLTSVTIPNSVTSIRARAFFKCTSLNSITIPNSVTHIGERAFNGCSNLTSIDFGGILLRTGLIVDSKSAINIDDDDTDGDGLTNYQELIVFGTDPQTADPSNLQYLTYSVNEKRFH